MKNNDPERLLSDVFGGQDVEALRQATLERGLARLRLRRRHRRIGRACVVAGLLLMPLFFLVFSLQKPEWKPAGLAKLPLNAPAASKAVKVITDEELFALFPNRPLALIGKPGHQQLVFLDQVGAPKTEESTRGAGL